MDQSETLVRVARILLLKQEWEQEQVRIKPLQDRYDLLSEQIPDLIEEYEHATGETKEVAKQLLCQVGQEIVAISVLLRESDVIYNTLPRLIELSRE